MRTEKNAMYYAGWVATILPVLVLFMSAYMKLSGNPEMAKQSEKFGYPGTIWTPLGTIEALCAILYLIPQTSILGAILLTGYLGGAVATHVRIGESPVAPIVVGVLLWLGLFLRHERIRSLLPLLQPQR